MALGLTLFAVYAVGLGLHAEPGSRLTAAEAHVLMTTASIADDGDLDLRNQYTQRTWRKFYGSDVRRTAQPDAAGRLLEPQGIGLPALLALPYKAGGTVAVRLLLAALAALAFVLAAALARRLVPDPWASLAALAFGLSPPVVAAATAVRPEIPAAAALAGAAILALRIRDDPHAPDTFWAAVLIGAVPWIALPAIVPAIMIALAMTRWLRRRRRGLAGFIALEVVLTSVVVFMTVNDRLYGGLTPYAARLHSGPVTGIGDAGDVLGRAGHPFELLFDLLRWAPVAALTFAGAYFIWQTHRERLTRVIGDHVHVEVVAAFMGLIFGMQLLAAAFLAPHIHGAWFPTRYLVPVLPFAAALAAWGFRRLPRTSWILAGLTVGLTAWMLLAGLTGDATLAPPSGFGFA